MKRRPATFGELLSRVAPSGPRDAIACQPVIASAVELENGDALPGRSMWVVLHSVTDAHVRLIHSQPVGSKRLSVRIQAATGEVLQATLETIDSRRQGELFETRAGFVRFDGN